MNTLKLLFATAMTVSTAFAAENIPTSSPNMICDCVTKGGGQNCAPLASNNAVPEMRDPSQALPMMNPNAFPANHGAPAITPAQMLAPMQQQMPLPTGTPNR